MGTRFFPSRRTAGLGAVAAVVAGLAAVLPTTASSATTIGLAIEVKTDGSSFTPSDGAGKDSDPNNGIVRTNDTVEYAVTVNASNGTATNQQFTVTAPSGTNWAALPEKCLRPGSRIAGQDLTCRVGDLAEGDVRSVSVVLTASGGMQNGETIAITGTATADEAHGPVPIAYSPTTTVSAAPRYDVSKNIEGSKLTTGVAGPDGASGVLIEYPIAIDWDAPVAGQGLLGFERSSGEFAFTDDVSKMYGGTTSPAVLFGRNGIPACGVNTISHFPTLPNGRGGAPQGVRDSGTITCSQSAPGEPITVRISGVDTSLTSSSIPTQNAQGSAIVGGTKPYVFVGYISIWLPTPPANTSFLAKNTYTALQTTSISGAPNFPGGSEPLANNAADRNLALFQPGGGFKAIGQIDDATGTVTPGSATAKDSDPYVTPGKNIRSLVRMTNRGLGAYQQAIACDVFDNRFARLTQFKGQWARTDGFTAARVEYAAFGFTDPVIGRDATCADTDAQWYSNPNDVPGGAAAVGMVRVVGNLAGGTDGSLFTYQQIQTAPSNTRARDFGQLYFGTTGNGAWVHDPYDPEPGAGGLADSVIITQDLARITKKVVDEDYDAATTPDETNFTAGGETLTYALYPTLTNSTDGGGKTTITITDVLPQHTSYKPGSASLLPTDVSSVTDSDGYQRDKLTWEMTVSPGSHIDPITMNVMVSKIAPAGPIVNTAVISAPTDVSAEKYRRAERSLQVITTGGVGVEKWTTAPVVVTGDELSWELGYTNTDASSIRNVDIIDVLPHGSSFHGTTHLSAPVATDPTGAETVRYTSAPADGVSLDPKSGSNQSGGATTWCSLDAFGTAGCPSRLENATAFRIERGSAVNVGQTVVHRITMQTVGAHADDEYTNRFGLAASNLALPSLSNRSTIRVVSGLIGEHVWLDQNRNGVQDASEPGVPGVAVSLSGHTDNNTEVHRQTETDSDGGYEFQGLRPGTYEVTFHAPKNRQFTIRHAGHDTTKDSDADATGQTQRITLTTVEDAEGHLVNVTDDRTVDAGLVNAPGTTTPPGEKPDKGTGTGAGGGVGSGSGSGSDRSVGGGKGDPHRAELAFTGADGLGIIGIVGLLLLLSGAAALTVRRRHSTRQR